MIERRSAEARVAYVEGFAAGWKQCMTEFLNVSATGRKQVKKRLDETLDFMSDVENDLREKETVDESR